MLCLYREEVEEKIVGDPKPSSEDYIKKYIQDFVYSLARKCQDMEIFGNNDKVKKIKHYIFLGSPKLSEGAIKDICMLAG